MEIKMQKNVGESKTNCLDFWQKTFAYNACSKA
jgi:hypothetical protein